MDQEGLYFFGLSTNVLSPSQLFFLGLSTMGAGKLSQLNFYGLSTDNTGKMANFDFWGLSPMYAEISDLYLNTIN